MASFDDFYPDQEGRLRKKIVLKVSDVRSAEVQSRFLARHGLWVSEYRIESGLNCGGHAFASGGHLLGPVLEEFQRRRAELSARLFEQCEKALRAIGRPSLRQPSSRITVQGGIGTFDEDVFLRTVYGAEGTGWGTPFLLVPEVTNVDVQHIQRLVQAGPDDVELSECSPVGVPFWVLKTSTSESIRRRRIEAGKPGSPCPKGYLAFNSDFTRVPICVASKVYQSKRLKRLAASQPNREQRETEESSVVGKSCLCVGLSGGAAARGEFDGTGELAVCCGPNIVNFDRELSLEELVDHIYGRTFVLSSKNRPHMFIRELQLYVEFLRGEVVKLSRGLISRTSGQLEEIRQTLVDGVRHYRTVAAQLNESSRRRFLEDLDDIGRELEQMVTGLTPALPDPLIP
jgi:hypothetical protein